MTGSPILYPASFYLDKKSRYYYRLTRIVLCEDRLYPVGPTGCKIYVPASAWIKRI